MFLTPKWDVSDISEKLNFELFGLDPSSRNKKLKKNRKKKEEVKEDKNGIKQNAFTSLTKQKRNKMKMHNVSKLNKINDANLSLTDKEELFPLLSESKMHSANPLLKSGIKRKHSVPSDSNLLELKLKKRKCEFSSKNNEASFQSSEKELHSCGVKLTRKQKRKQKKKMKSKNTLQDNINVENKDLSQNTVTNHGVEFDTRKEKKMKKLRQKLKTSMDVEKEDSLQNSLSTMNSQSNPPKEQKSSYNIKKLKNILEISSNSEQPFKENKSLSKQKKNECSLRERMIRKLKACRFRYLNEQLYTSGGKDSKEYFQSDPEAFHAYHEGYQQQLQQWPINPLDVIIKSLQKKSSELVIADFGCGDAKLAHSVKNLVHSFDLVAVSKEVTACDMAHTSLSNASVDIVVFCLSLMGNNLTGYLIEANRVLKEGGLMKIAEVESRFDSIETFIHNLNKFGFMI